MYIWSDALLKKRWPNKKLFLARRACITVDEVGLIHMKKAGSARQREGAHQLSRRQCKKMRCSEDNEPGDEEEEVPPEKITRKIIQRASEQQIEEEAESAAAALSSRSSRGNKAADDSDDQDINSNADLDSADEDLATEEYEYYQDVDNCQLCVQDERAFDYFMCGKAPRTLADVISEKLAQKAAISGLVGKGSSGDIAEEPLPMLPPKVMEVYKGVGKLLKSYKSGKLPKAFKIMPRLANWEEVLFVTEPESWTPIATREVHRKPNESLALFEAPSLPFFTNAV